jgi:hypothetical protein
MRKAIDDPPRFFLLLGIEGLRDACEILNDALHLLCHSLSGRIYGSG